ncbi:polyamine-modulated factor 1 isoform 10 [Daubentonia madagascariensis]|uniref:Polyamine-modulated factor 1 isoform 10 n=1 Tax=Daubentonia madagascariensis TaxID=31869 RepID=A0ABD2DXW3_DAUMA
MAEASDVNVGDGCEEKGPEGSSSEPVPPGTIISRVKLLDTMVDTFLQKLVAAGSNGIPCGAMCRNRRPRTSSWQMPFWLGAGRWRSCSYRFRPSSRPGRLYTENRGSWWLC